MANSQSFNTLNLNEGTGGVTWSNLSNARVIDNNIALCDLSQKNSTPNPLGYAGIPLPPRSATLNGLTVSIRRRAQSGTIGDSMMQIYDNNGNQVSTNKANSSEWGTTLQTVVYGGSNDPWGITLANYNVLHNNSTIIENIPYANAQIVFSPSGQGIVELDGLELVWYYAINNILYKGVSGWSSSEFTENGTTNRVYIKTPGSWVEV